MKEPWNSGYGWVGTVGQLHQDMEFVSDNEYYEYCEDTEDESEDKT